MTDTIKDWDDAVKAGFDPIEETLRREHEESQAKPESSEPRAPEYSDAALADTFAERHAKDLRYVAMANAWYRFNGIRWQQEETALAFDLAKKVCVEIAAGCNQKDSIRKALASKGTVYAVECLARSDRRLAATTDQWDRDPFLLNTPGGVIDLNTGVTRPHSPDDYMTKMTAVAPQGECPLFMKFLNRVVNDDQEYVAYLARVFGYGLTGSTKEHAMFFLYGTGGNGKGVLIATITKAMGDYHTAADIQTFTETKFERHPTDLAKLAGPRLVTSEETEKGRKWAEARLKSLIAGDMQSARFMRGDFFDFKPQLKLVISGNHKPSLSSVDRAMRRRINVLPFTVEIPEAEKDPDLSGKLAKELPGILQWMLDGLADYRRNGLKPPRCVTEASDEYFVSEDHVQNWIDECCTVDGNHTDLLQNLFGSFSLWATRNGVASGTSTGFSQSLANKGFRRFRNANARGFTGIKVS